MNITNILDFLRRPASGSAALRAKLDEVTNALPEAEATVARLAAERAAGLLDASDAALEKVERAHADARRAVDRLRAAQEELTRRLDEAEREEARAALDAERADAERLAAETADRVRRDYAKAAKTIATLVAETDVAERRVAEVNAKLEAAGRFNEMVKPCESRAIPEPEHVLPGPYKLAACSLVPAPGFGGIGLARERAIVAGIVAAQLG